MSGSTRRRGDEQFARLTISLLQHPAVTTLSHTAFRVLTVLTIGARPPGLNPRKDAGRNGVQAITHGYACKFGLTSKDTLFRAVQELIDHGLIVRTREGHKSKSHFALYAVAWLPISHWDGQPLDTRKPAPHGYLSFNPELKRKKPIGRKLELQPDGRAQTSPMIGHDRPGSGPIVSSSLQICAPIVGDTLRVLDPHMGGGSSSRSDLGPNQASKSLVCAPVANRKIRIAKKIAANCSRSESKANGAHH
jgi:hypothetical protein